MVEAKLNRFQSPGTHEQDWAYQGPKGEDSEGQQRGADAWHLVVMMAESLPE